MMAYVSALAARVEDSVFSRYWRKAADVADCVIPIGIVLVLLVSCAAMAFGFVN